MSNTPAPSLAVTPEQVADLKQRAEKARDAEQTARRSGTTTDFDASHAAYVAMDAKCNADVLLALCQAVERMEKALTMIAGWEDARANLAASYGDTDSLAIQVADLARAARSTIPPEPADVE